MEVVSLKAFSKVFKAGKQLHSLSLQEVRVVVWSRAEEQNGWSKSPKHCNLLTLSAYIFLEFVFLEKN